MGVLKQKDKNMPARASPRRRRRSRPTKGSKNYAGYRKSCAKKACRKPYLCHPVDRVCYRRTDPEITDVADILGRGLPDPRRRDRRMLADKSRRDPYPANWSKKPGDAGFNSYVNGLIKTNVESRPYTCPLPGEKQLPRYHQLVVKYLMHPRTPVDRLLVAHQLGSGKTYLMISILENYYRDPRSKFLLFPNTALVQNFYSQLLRFPGPYRTFVEREIGPVPSTKSALSTYIKKAEDVLAFKRTLKKTRGVGDPAGPIRAFMMVRAGGKAFMRDPLVKRNRLASTPANTFSNAIVMVDEAHYLVKPREGSTAPQIKNFVECARRIHLARNSVVALMTATPVVAETLDGSNMLRIAMGVENTEKKQEGFVSYYMARPAAVFAATDRETSDITGSIVQVPIRGRNLEKYLSERLKKSGGYRPEKSTFGNYEHMQAFWQRAMKNSEFLNGLKDSPIEYATKLARIANDVAETREKTMIMLDRTNGFKVMERLLELRGVSYVSLYDKATAASEELRLNFNDETTNLRGERYQVILLDPRFYSEGVSIMHVRRIVMADLSQGLKTPSWSILKQRLGRALRMCSHEALRPEERRIKTRIYVSVVEDPPVADFKTIDQRKVEALVAQRDTIEGAMSELEKIAVDRGLYK